MDQASGLRQLAKKKRSGSSSQAIGAAVTVFSGSVAAGKTSATLSLASSLAATGHKVLVIDGSRQSTRFSRHVPGSCPMSAFLGAGRKELTLSTDHGFAAVHSDRENISQVSHLIAEAVQRETGVFDYVLVDAGDVDVAVECCGVSSLAIGLMTPEFPSVRDTYAAARMIAQIGVGSVGIVANMAADEGDALRNFGAVSQTLLRHTGLMVEFAGWVRYLPNLASGSANPVLLPGGDSRGSGFYGVSQWILSRNTIYRERQRESFR